MTKEQQAQLGELCVLVGTADDMMRQARAAIAQDGAGAYTTAKACFAIRAAHDNLTIAASELLGVLNALPDDDDGVLLLADIAGEVQP